MKQANRSYTVLKIKQGHQYYNWCESACLQSRYLYNTMLYEYRNSYFDKDIKNLTNTELYRIGKESCHWVNLPAKCSNHVWMQLITNISSYWAAVKEYNKNPNKFNKPPKLPNYNKGMNIVTFDNQALLTNKLPAKHIRLVRTDMILDLSRYNGEIREVQIIPKKNHFIIKAIFKQTIKQEDLSYDTVASIDIGVNNLAAITTNQVHIRHILINGRPLKSINQFYNKTKAKHQSNLPKKQKSSNRIRLLSDKRNNKIQDYIHKASRYIVNWLIENKIGTLVIGKNKEWKQEVNIGAKNNQSFTMIPHARFIDLIIYKFESVGGIVKLVNEAYTSKCSALDLEPICKQTEYKGNRIKRGLFKSSKGVIINADINGSLNILRKAVGNDFLSNSIESQQWAIQSPSKITL
jgi:putative transposase